MSLVLALAQARLPHDVEVERAVLGAVMTWGARAYERCSGLSDDDWALLGHRAIWRAMAGGALDAVGVAAAVRDDPDVGELGGPGYIGHLIAAACAAIQVGHHARTLRGLTRRRQRIERAAEEQRAAYADEEPLPVGILPELGGGRLASYDAADELAGDIPPREWLLGTVLCRQYLTVLAASGASGKTSLLIGWALSLATGRPLIGEYVHHRTRVLLLTLEDGRDELRRRLRAACMHHGIHPEDLRGWLNVRSLTGEGHRLVRRSEMGQLSATTVAADLEAEVRRLGSGAVLADPFVALSGAAENDNVETEMVARLLRDVAERANVAVCVAHHTRKGNSGGGDMDMARGAKSLIDAARIGLTLTAMSDADAQTFGIDTHDRRKLIRLDDGKTNLAPAGSAKWYRLASVNIDNGTDDYQAGDNLPAVETWTPPSAWDGISTATLNAILDDIDAGLAEGERYSAARSAKTRAAWRVVQAHRPDLTEPQCREVIRTWVANGVLVSETYQSSVTFRDAEGLRVEAAKRPG